MTYTLYAFNDRINKLLDIVVLMISAADRSSHPELHDGASIHIELSSFQVDYYPYHLAVKDRDHWSLYKTARYPHPQWLSQSQNEFRNLLLSLVEDDFLPSPCTGAANPVGTCSLFVCLDFKK